MESDLQRTHYDMNNKELRDFVESLAPNGFMFATKEQEQKLLQLDRFFPVLVRCGTVRFICSIMYLETMIKMVSFAGDYIRDVSIPVDKLDELGIKFRQF